jgi:hypothetical protein
MMQNLGQVVQYYMHAEISTPGGLLTYWLPGVGRQLGWAFTLLMVGMLLWEWRAAYQQEFRWFFWAACLTLAATHLIGIYTALENFVVLLPAIILIMGTWDQRWGRIGRVLVLLSLLLFVVGGWGISIIGVRKGIPPSLDPVLYLTTPVLTILGLYWVRWMAIHPPQLPLQVLGRRLRR